MFYTMVDHNTTTPGWRKGYTLTPAMHFIYSHKYNANSAENSVDMK